MLISGNKVTRAKVLQQIRKFPLISQTLGTMSVFFEAGSENHPNVPTEMLLSFKEFVVILVS